MSAPAAGLARRMLGGFGLWLFAVSASSPMTVLAGSVPATFASGVVGVPLSFLMLGPVLALLSVGYVAVAGRVRHAAPLYAVLVHGLGRVVGVAGGAVAVLAYNCIQVCLYGLLGATLAADLGGRWWVWALVAWLTIGLLGVLHVRVNAAVLGWALGMELLLVGLLIAAGVTHPAGGHLSAAPLSPGALFVEGVGGAFALAVAAFTGYEQPPVYAEEARRPESVMRATFAALGVLCVVYAAGSWALAAAVGPGGVVTAAQQGQGLLFTVLREAFGPLWGTAAAGLGRLLLVTSMVAAMLAFHNAVARHLFALGREGVAPRRLGRVGAGTGGRSGAPVAGSLAQSAIALATVAVFAVAGADPVTALFTWLATVAALAVLSLLTASCLAALGFFARMRRRQVPVTAGVFTRIVGPLLGFAAGVGVLWVTARNLEALLDVESGSPLITLIPGLVVLAAAVGLLWGWWLRARHPRLYRGIGGGPPHPLAMPEPRLALLDV